MKEWLVANIDWLAPCVASLFSLTSVSSIIPLVISASFRKRLKKARESCYWTKCPHCQKVILLKDIDFFMPGSNLVDNDLNGKADSEE